MIMTTKIGMPKCAKKYKHLTKTNCISNITFLERYIYMCM